MKKKALSLFIIKPGFTTKFNEIEELLNDNQIYIENSYFGKIDKDILEKHYAEHFGKPFYNGLIDYMQNGKVGNVKFNPDTVVMEVSGTKDETPEVFISRTRALVKESIRTGFALKREDYPELSNEEFKELSMTANVIHASDSPESAIREIANMSPLFERTREFI